MTGTALLAHTLFSHALVIARAVKILSESGMRRRMFLPHSRIHSVAANSRI
jgi:hypothetical protein